MLLLGCRKDISGLKNGDGLLRNERMSTECVLLRTYRNHRNHLVAVVFLNTSFHSKNCRIGDETMLNVCAARKDYFGAAAMLLTSEMSFLFNQPANASYPRLHRVSWVFHGWNVVSSGEV